MVVVVLSSCENLCVHTLVAIRYMTLREPAGVVDANLPWGWFALIRPKQDDLRASDQRPALDGVGKLEPRMISFVTGLR
jgi:hypothetical protein